MKKPKLKRRNPAVGDVVNMAELIPGLALQVTLDGLTFDEQVQVVAAAHRARQHVLATRRICPRCGPISVELSRHTCPYSAGPKPDPSGPAKTAGILPAKPLKGHAAQ